MSSILTCISVSALFFAASADYVPAQSESRNETNARVRDLCIVVGDKSAKSEARRSALKEVVEKYFQPGMSVRKLSKILSNFTFLKTGDCEFIRAFAGAWPFDESLLMSGNTMVCFRVRWNDPDSSAVVWFLIGGHQPDDGLLIPLFTGKWPANSKSTLMAVKLGMP